MPNQVFKGNLISAGMNAKTVKGDKAGEYVTAIMYLAPADMVDGINVCPMAVIAGCKMGCLNTAGRGRFNNVQLSRIRKTTWYRDNRAAFMDLLSNDLERFTKWCEKRGVKPAVRLNGTSDIQWERGHPVFRGGERFASVFEAFPEVSFYDYTKVYKRAYRDLPDNYHLTLSYSLANVDYADTVVQAALDTGTSFAVVFRTKAERDSMVENGLYWVDNKGFRVIDGDKTDLRFLDPRPVVVGLYAKGSAKKDTSGFVVDAPKQQ